MLKFPKWLPANVAAHCADKLNSGALSEEQKQCIIRLTSHESMRSVWETLEKEIFKKEKPDPSKLVNMIEDVRLHPTVLYPESKTPKLSSANQRKVMAQISKLSQNLLNTFAQLDSAAQDANKGIQFLLQEMSRMQKMAASQQEGKLVIRIHELQEGLKEADASFGIAEMFQALQEASALAINILPDGPRKQGAKTASRTLFIKDLKRYIKYHFRKQLNQVVATIVNTAMNLDSETVTEDMVRKA